MIDWGKTSTRSFGVVHLIYGAVGILFLLQGFLRMGREVVQFDRYPYERQFYYADMTVEMCFVFTLIVAGLFLIRLSRQGVIVSNYIFIIEIAFWLAYSLLSLGLKMHGGNAAVIGMSMGAVAGAGGMATAIQFITGYPLIALVGLNIARRRLDRRGSWSKPAPTPP